MSGIAARLVQPEQECQSPSPPSTDPYLRKLVPPSERPNHQPTRTPPPPVDQQHPQCWWRSCMPSRSNGASPIRAWRQSATRRWASCSARSRCATGAWHASGVSKFSAVGGNQEILNHVQNLRGQAGRRCKSMRAAGLERAASAHDQHRRVATRQHFGCHRSHHQVAERTVAA